MRILLFFIFLFLSLTLTACATSRSGSVYTRDQARQVQQVELGTVAAVRSVLIEGTKTPIGSIGGAAVGAIAGSAVGGGRGSDIAAVVGGIGGWLLGSAAEEGVTRQDGLEITVRLDSGRTIAVVQAADEVFKTGERVRLVSGDEESRVVH
ncbi:glycine zipper 2TM domain-containing protein [Beggiatoa leptomitoformis]|uniref:Glycine zipper 2TM domain-containing protein n=1 Tax=Beggiatoa leptomitoformis TaxID=288004 RepID=A0A2N9YBU7_9GAMM|nr:glycine zipper 2TM domain-containing protein [Beggiatoa leptomitoformis]ALG66748.1 glycine zipper 2TM domain-containing protein [Beggiatoa leptomitoformis]AUI67912.1 glycine zipper 2TM domain-containing protein [Beggiatoa leptomitoformis]